jgi:phosphoribosylformylglycinamidine synthase subunit PurQ / glutaminase
MRAIKQSGMDALYFRWNDDRSLLRDCDGYVFPGGFSYEDRGRSGMVAARDPLLEIIGQEAEKGKVVIGNCNGAQILVESGLVPVDGHLRMSLAHNAVPAKQGTDFPGFISEWVWITPGCAKDRCATSNWQGAMHVPIAHGEGRFTAVDPDLFEYLEANQQIAFRYCNEQGTVSDQFPVTPNGSTKAIAGICNPAGNVVALMPHPERTPLGKPYFDSVKLWIESKRSFSASAKAPAKYTAAAIEPAPEACGLEVFIDTLITNNEERTTEQALKRVLPLVQLHQWQYYTVATESALKQLLADLTIFNVNKQRSFVRVSGQLFRWHHDSKSLQAAEPADQKVFATDIRLVRIDRSHSDRSGVCYGLTKIQPSALTPRALEVLGNPHASHLYQLA